MSVKNAGCSSRRCGFNSWHPHGGSQSSITLVLGDLMSTYGLWRSQVYMWFTDIHTGKTPFTWNKKSHPSLFILVIINSRVFCHFGVSVQALDCWAVSWLSALLMQSYYVHRAWLFDISYWKYCFFFLVFVLQFTACEIWYIQKEIHKLFWIQLPEISFATDILIYAQITIFCLNYLNG